MTFDELKAAVKSHVNLTSQDADTRVGQAINRHYRRITSLLGMDVTRFVTRSATTTPGVQTVTFSEIEKIDRLIDTTDSGAIRVLPEVSQHTQRASQPGTSNPCSWSIQAAGASSVTVLLDTIPQTAYSLQADGTTTLADLSETDSPAFPESFHDILVWAVIAEELWRKEKDKLATAFELKANTLLGDLRFYINDSHTLETRQGGSPLSTLGGGPGGGSGTVGGTAYTQTGLLTFDRGSGIAPFAVAQSNAATVTNLDADKLDGEDGTYYLDRANHTGALGSTDLQVTATDRLIGRDSSGSGPSEEISVGGGIEFTGTSGLQTSAFTGDVTKTAGGTALTLAADAVTYAKLQNVTTSERALGRATPGAGDVEELTLSQLLDFIGSAAQGDLLYRGAATWSRLGAGTTGQVLTQGSSASPVWAVAGATAVYVLDRDVTVVDVNTSTTETTVYTYTVPANTLSTNRGLRLTLIGDYANTTGAPDTLTVRVKYGATTIASAAHTISQSANRAAQSVRSTMIACNSTSAQRAFTEWASSEGGENNAAGTMTLDSNTNRLFRGAHTSIAENSTGALALAVTVQHGTSSASISFRCHVALLEVLT